MDDSTEGTVISLMWSVFNDIVAAHARGDQEVLADLEDEAAGHVQTFQHVLHDPTPRWELSAEQGWRAIHRYAVTALEYPGPIDWDGYADELCTHYPAMRGRR